MTLAQPFEVQYLLDASDEVASQLRRRLEELGDSVVVVAGGGLLNVHVHTAMVGPAIEAGLEHGRPTSIEISHFGDQIAALTAARPHAGLGVVAVLSGAGTLELARQAGASVVDGTAGSLPSVDELMRAIATAAADRVVLLPGHGNVVAAAGSAALLGAAEAQVRVEVIEAAATPPAVLAALAVFDPDGDGDAVVADMRRAASQIRSGEVVAAVRDASTPAGPVSAGQPLGIAAGEVVAAAQDPVDALEQVCAALGTDDAELVTLLVGAEVDDDERDAAVLMLERTSAAEVEVVDAGLRPARFWVGVE